MSRSNYSEDIDGWDLVRWRGAVNSAIKGKRGQTLLKEMAIALEAMPVKRLIADELNSKDEEVCALGAVAKYKSLKVDDVDPHRPEQVSAVFNIADALVREIAFENDEYYDEMPEERYRRMKTWVMEHIKKENP